MQINQAHRGATSKKRFEEDYVKPVLQRSLQTDSRKSMIFLQCLNFTQFTSTVDGN